MLSREKELIRIRDNYSIFLSQIRSAIKASRFRHHLRIQQIADSLFLSGRIRPVVLEPWIIEISTTLDSLSRGLEEGRWRRTDVNRLLHLYRHLID